MKLSGLTLVALIVLAGLALTCNLGCSKNSDEEDASKTTTSATGQHSPPPMARKAGVAQAGGGAPNSAQAADN